MDEKKIQKKLLDFAKKRDWERFHNLKNLAISISIESSELLEIFQWIEDKNINEHLRDKTFRKRISEEVADVLLYLLRFSEIANLNLEKICLDKIKINEKKYPINLSKGKSTKYTDLNVLKK
tara:strand:+ start:46 stop:411 length:366 start_codon:yes stop_codon:yes gene_type:complete